MHLLTKIRRAFITSIPVKFLVRKSKKILLPGFYGIPLYDVINFFFTQIRKTSLNERASSISFNLLMAIPPACIFLFTLIPYLPVKGLINELFDLIRDVIPGEKRNAAIIEFLTDFTSKQRNGLLSFGLLLAFFFSSNAMIGIMRSFNKSFYLGFKIRTAFHDRFEAVKLTLILFLIIILSIAALVLRDRMLIWLGIEQLWIISLILNLRWVVIILLFFFTISFIYRHAPAVHKKWKLVNPGSLLATFLMLLFTAAFSYYVANFANYNKLYGSIGTIMIIMLLIYFNSLVLLIGFELNVSINSLKRISDKRKNTRPDG